MLSLSLSQIGNTLYAMLFSDVRCIDLSPEPWPMRTEPLMSCKILSCGLHHIGNCAFAICIASTILMVTRLQENRVLSQEQKMMPMDTLVSFMAHTVVAGDVLLMAGTDEGVTAIIFMRLGEQIQSPESVTEIRCPTVVCMERDIY